MCHLVEATAVLSGILKHRILQRDNHAIACSLSSRRARTKLHTARITQLAGVAAND